MNETLRLAQIRLEVSKAAAILRGEVHESSCLGHTDKGMARGTCTCLLGRVAERYGRIRAIAKDEPVAIECASTRRTEG